jgi:hypothetical protein
MPQAVPCERFWLCSPLPGAVSASVDAHIRVKSLETGQQTIYCRATALEALQCSRWLLQQIWRLSRCRSAIEATLSDVRCGLFGAAFGARVSESGGVRTDGIGRRSSALEMPSRRANATQELLSRDAAEVEASGGTSRSL